MEKLTAYRKPAWLPHPSSWVFFYLSLVVDQQQQIDAIWLYLPLMLETLAALTFQRLARFCEAERLDWRA